MPPSSLSFVRFSETQNLEYDYLSHSVVFEPKSLPKGFPSKRRNTFQPAPLPIYSFTLHLLTRLVQAEASSVFQMPAGNIQSILSPEGYSDANYGSRLDVCLHGTACRRQYSTIRSRGRRRRQHSQERLLFFSQEIKRETSSSSNPTTSRRTHEPADRARTTAKGCSALPSPRRRRGFFRTSCNSI
jgi:hypothetical protein